MQGASVAVIQGASGSIGTAFVRQLLQRSSLNVVATSRDANTAREQILSGPGSSLDPDRLTVLEMDVLREDSIVEAARHVKDKWGKGSLRFLVNVSGVLHIDKSITQIKMEDLLHSYQINTFGHILTFKHFMPLLPSASDLRKSRERGDEDLADGMIKEGMSVMASLTARVGSIGDNKRGGWTGYRSSKAATNQVIMSLQRELQNRSTPSIAVALHPGTVPGTNLSSAFTKASDAGYKPGVFGADDSARQLMDVVRGLKEEDGGKFMDWAGKEIVW